MLDSTFHPADTIADAGKNPARAKQLVVNADDLGIAPEVNRAVAQAHAAGILTSASLMVNMPYSQDAVENVVRRYSHLGVGLHLCLTSGAAISAARDIPLLVDSAGNFRHGFFGLGRLLISAQREQAVVQIYGELAAQLQLARSWGIALDHLNSHQHVHMIGPLFAVVSALARRHHLPLRVPHERFGPWSRRIAQLGAWVRSGGLAKRALLSTLARIASPAGRDRGQAAFFGILDSGRMSLAAWRRVLTALPEGVSEVAVHPAYSLRNDPARGCSRADRKFLASPRRQMELDALRDPRLRREIDRQQIALVRFADVRRADAKKARAAA